MGKKGFTLRELASSTTSVRFGPSGSQAAVASGQETGRCLITTRTLRVTGPADDFRQEAHYGQKQDGEVRLTYLPTGYSPILQDTLVRISRTPYSPSYDLHLSV